MIDAVDARDLLAETQARGLAIGPLSGAVFVDTTTLTTAIKTLLAGLDRADTFISRSVHDLTTSSASPSGPIWGCSSSATRSAIPSD